MNNIYPIFNNILNKVLTATNETGKLEDKKANKPAGKKVEEEKKVKTEATEPKKTEKEKKKKKKEEEEEDD